MTQSNNVSLQQKSFTWWDNLSVGEKNHYKHMYPNTDGFLSDKEIETIYLKEHPTEAEVRKEEAHNPLLADSLSKYIYDKHTQEECIGFIDGFKASQKQDRVLISELVDLLNMFRATMTSEHYTNEAFDKLDKVVTKAEKHLNNQ